MKKVIVTSLLFAMIFLLFAPLSYSQAKPKHLRWLEEETNFIPLSEGFKRANIFFRVGRYKDAIRVLKWSAENFDILCINLLAKMYREGIGTERDMSKALRMYRLMDRCAHPLGTYMIGVFYENGWTVEKDYEKARHYYQRAVKKSNYAEAQRALGSLYFGGRGVKKDFKEAWKWFIQAAEQNNPRAMYNVAICMERGLGTAKNPEEAMNWYQKAAAAGEVKAMHALGSHYELGIIVERDPDIAINWFSTAAVKGYMESFYRLGKVYKSKAGSSEAHRMYAGAVQSFARAAQKGHLDAVCEVGIMYEKGEGVGLDPLTAANWYAAAAEKGYERGQFLLGLLYLRGKGLEKDEQKAMLFINAAAEAKYPPAVEWLKNR